MAESKQGIGYAVYCPSRDTFLGKMGEWYTDIRLAAIYAEPRAAKMAIGRLDFGWPCQAVPVVMSVRAIDLEPVPEKKEEEAKHKDESKPQGNGQGKPTAPVVKPKQAA